MASDLYEHTIKAELAHWPGVDVEFSDRAKHRQAVFHFRGETRFIVLPASPSDGARGHLNSIRDARKELAALGAERAEKKPRARKRTNRVIGRKMPNAPVWTNRERAPVKVNPFDVLAAVTFAPKPTVPRLSLWRRIWNWLGRLAA